MLEPMKALTAELAEEFGVAKIFRPYRDELGGGRLKTKPRGYDADHPRIELLRHKSLVLGRMIGFEPVIHTGALVEEVRRDWRAIRPVSEWIAEHAQA